MAVNKSIRDDIIFLLYNNGKMDRENLFSDLKGFQQNTPESDIIDTIADMVEQGLIQEEQSDHIEGRFGYLAFSGMKTVYHLSESGEKENGLTHMGDLDALTSIRLEYLRQAYLRSGGDTYFFLNLWEIGNSLKLGRRLTWLVYQYLSHEGLLVGKGLGGEIGITHYGVKTVEALEQERRNERKAFIEKISTRFLRALYIKSHVTPGHDVSFLDLKENLGILDKDWPDVIDYLENKGYFDHSSKTTGYVTELGEEALNPTEQKNVTIERY